MTLSMHYPCYPCMPLHSPITVNSPAHIRHVQSPFQGTPSMPDTPSMSPQASRNGSLLEGLAQTPPLNQAEASALQDLLPLDEARLRNSLRTHFRNVAHASETLPRRLPECPEMAHTACTMARFLLRGSERLASIRGLPSISGVAGFSIRFPRRRWALSHAPTCRRVSRR